MTKIAVTTTSFGKYDPTVLDPVKKLGMEIVFNELGRQLKEEEIPRICSDCIGIIAGTEKLDKRSLAALKSLKAVSRCGAGMDNVDVEAAKSLGIKVANTPDAPTDAVAELTLGVMIDVMRKVTKADRDIRKGIWKKPMGNLIKGKKAGIIGFGRIGRAVAALLLSFGAEIYYFDQVKNDIVKNAKFMPFEELLSSCEILSLHLPYDKTKGALLTKDNISTIKKGAFLFNISRGGLVSEEALFEALRSGHLAGAGIDTFETEPYKGKLIELENVVLTPHIGSYAVESRILMERQSVRNLLKLLEENV
ncbi:MAG: phosphoglycerate dehydrogenase [Candidatus Margulisiibacteriota bacterium]